MGGDALMESESGDELVDVVEHISLSYSRCSLIGVNGILVGSGHDCRLKTY